MKRLTIHPAPEGSHDKAQLAMLIYEFAELTGLTVLDWYYIRDFDTLEMRVVRLEEICGKNDGLDRKPQIRRQRHP